MKVPEGAAPAGALSALSAGPARRGLELWVVRLDDPFLCSLAPSVLSSEERKLAGRFASEELSRRYAVSHGVLRKLLGRWLGCSPENVRFVFNDFGKPFVEGGPWFSLSHSEDVAVIGISLDREIGVDVEKVRPFGGISEIMEQFFAPEERAWIRSSSFPSENIGTDGLERRFFRCWTLREAFTKALGCGLSLPLDTFYIRFPSADDDEPAVIMREEQSCRAYLQEWFPVAGFAGALALLDKA